MLYSKTNYFLMALSVLLIVLGFVVMSGGGSSDPMVFNEEIFSPSRIKVAPLICVAGFGLMIYAILYRAKPGRQTEEN